MEKKPQYIYDINYRLKTTSVFSVVARSELEARRKANEDLQRMSKAELIDRFLCALDFCPEFTITTISKIDSYEED